MRDRIRQIKQAKLGLRRQETLYRLYKEYLANKPTREQALDIIDRSAHLRVDVSNESLYLDGMIDVVIQFEQDYEKLHKKPSDFKNPTAKANDLLINACCFPIKSQEVEAVLELWNVSMNWQIRAKQFLQDKLSQEQVEDLKAFCEDMPKQPAFGLVETGGAEFIWDLEKVKQMLLEQVPRLADPNLLSRVKDKYSLIEMLKLKIRQDLKSLDDPKQLNELVRELESMQTFDFKIEI